jgi:hypothetical protein
VLIAPPFRSLFDFGVDGVSNTTWFDQSLP